MKKGYFYIGAVLDRSGSMHENGKIIEARNGFNNLISEKKKQNFSFDVFLTIFDDKIETIYNGNIQNCPELTEQNFSARGMTSLYDAIGTTIKQIGETLNNKHENDRPEKVIICIITDGQENNSKEFKSDRISAMINEQKNNYSWEFIFMGADQASIENAKKIGIDSSVKYDDKVKGGTMKAYGGISRSIDLFTNR